MTRDYKPRPAPASKEKSQRPGFFLFIVGMLAGAFAIGVAWIKFDPGLMRSGKALDNTGVPRPVADPEAPKVVMPQQRPGGVVFEFEQILGGRNGAALKGETPTVKPTVSSPPPIVATPPQRPQSPPPLQPPPESVAQPVATTAVLPPPIEDAEPSPIAVPQQPLIRPKTQAAAVTLERPKPPLMHPQRAQTQSITVARPQIQRAPPPRLPSHPTTTVARSQPPAIRPPQLHTPTLAAVRPQPVQHPPKVHSPTMAIARPQSPHVSPPSLPQRHDSPPVPPHPVTAHAAAPSNSEHGGAFALQIGVFKETGSNLQNLRARLAMIGVETQIQSDGKLHRLRTSTYHSRSELEEVRRMLSRNHINTIVVK
jgi:hypothetical protein